MPSDREIRDRRRLAIREILLHDEPVLHQHDLVNRLQELPSWPETAVVLLYDDSDGSYDHVPPPLVNTSQTGADALTGPGRCGAAAPRLAGYQGRCGYGPRLPFLVISPWSRVDHVDLAGVDARHPQLPADERAAERVARRRDGAAHAHRRDVELRHVVRLL